jgi:hypothetical protein
VILTEKYDLGFSLTSAMLDIDLGINYRERRKE